MNQSTQNDGELLQQFAASGEQAAFEALVNRHSAMVFGLCSRLLGRTHDAEDAAQAVFLTLAHKAGSLRHHPSIAGWLHRVALNVSLRTRQAAGRRDSREREAQKMTANDSADQREWEELRPYLDEELNALPEKYRVPIILHYIEGRTQEEIATLLGTSYGAVSGRLNHARGLLRERLNRRRVTLTAAALFVQIPKFAPVAMPEGVAASTIKAAVLIAAGNAAAPGVVSAQAAALTEGALRMIYLARMKTAAAIVIGAILVSVIGTGTYHALAGSKPAAAVPVAAPAPVVQKKERAPVQEVAGPEDKAGPSKADLEAWISALALEDAAQRVEAYNKLRDAGEAARAALEAASKNSKAEVSSAAKTLLGVLSTKPVIDKLTEAAKGVKSIEANIKIAALTMGAEVAGSGTVRQLLDEKKMYSTMTMKMGNMEIPMNIVCDGTTYWQEMTIPVGEKGAKMVMKYPASYMNDMNNQSSESPLSGEALAKSWDFVTTAEGTLNGKPVYILSGKRTPGQAEQQIKAATDLGGENAAAVARAMVESMDSAKVYISKDDNLVAKLEMLNKEGKSVQSVEFTDIKLNPKFDAALFTYCPPAGAQVVDAIEQAKAMKGNAPAAVTPPAPPAQGPGNF
jgi:RNA polymerase sigma factor (sigma-70 family)